MRISPSPASRLALASVAAGLLAMACGGGGNDDDTVNEADADARPITDQGDDDASVTFADAVIVWALDGEAVGPRFSYEDPIERDRFEAGLRWELRFDAMGDAGDVEVDIPPRISVNGDQMEGVSRLLGPEDARLRVDEPFVAAVDGDQIVLSVDVARPMTGATLLDERAVFEFIFGVSADIERIDFDEDSPIVVNIDRYIDLPPIGSNVGNTYEFEARGDLVLGNGTEVEVRNSTTMQVVDPAPIELNLAGPCMELAEQYADQLPEQFDDPALVFVDRLLAMTALREAADTKECPGVEFRLPACAAAQAAVEERAADETVEPFARALTVCPSDQALLEATLVEATLDDGTLRLVVPAEANGVPALAVAMSVPGWEVQVDPPRASGQAVEFELPDAARGTEAEFEVTTADEGNYDEAATAERGREVARGERRVDDRVAEWFVSATAGGYEFGGAARLPDGRLFAIRGLVIETEVRAPTDESMTALASCLIDSVVVVEWSFDAAPLDPATDCTQTGVFVPDAIADLQEDAAAAPAGPTLEAGVVTIPVPSDEGQLANLVTASVPADWSLSSVVDQGRDLGVILEGSEPFSVLRLEVREGEAAAEIEERLGPAFSFSVVTSDTIEQFVDREVRIVVQETDSSALMQKRADFALALDGGRMLSGLVSVDLDSPIDPEAVLREMLATLEIAI